VKPQNETEIKVIDFGSSCYEHQPGRYGVGFVVARAKTLRVWQDIINGIMLVVWFLCEFLCLLDLVFESEVVD